MTSIAHVSMDTNVSQEKKQGLLDEQIKDQASRKCFGLDSVQQIIMQVTFPVIMDVHMHASDW